MGTEDPKRQKLHRLSRGEPPRLLDLFAGCGGLSLGFHAAGFNIVGAVELDPLASRSHAVNFHRDAAPDLLEAHAQSRDITKNDPADLLETLRIRGKAENCIDVIVGGPPCQAFARVGRAKLREVAEHPQAFRQDPRANLYLRYLEYVKELQPLAILMENVPDVLNFGGHNIPDEVCEALTDLGYVCKYSLLNAAYYGVPQMRERMFLIAYAHELDFEPRFPCPTHWIELPRGYEGSRQVALKHLGCGTLFADTYYFPPPPASDDLRPAITAIDALRDLPSITLHLRGELRRGARRFTEVTPYPKSQAISRYARLMRKWPGFEGHGGITDHVIRYLPRDYKLFRRMNHGDQYPEAHAHAMVMFEEELACLAKQGQHLSANSSDFRRLKASIVPPYDPGKFPNKWRKMEPDLPARTLMAHLGKDGYSHIHYDSRQARTISVREAARLQSFPDGFVFCGTMNPAFRQIGNAVPPLMANAVAHQFLRALRIKPYPKPLSTLI